MKIKALFFVLLFMMYHSISISNCTSLQNIPTTGDHNLTNDIDCSIIPNFNPIVTFQGCLNGNGFGVYNLTIKNLSSSTGLFKNGFDAIVKNIGFFDFYVESSNSSIAFLFGQCFNCVIDSVIFNTSSPLKSNIINGTSSTVATIYAAGLMSYSSNCTISNSIIQNTVLYAPQYQYIGSFVGLGSQIKIQNCHNLGFPSGTKEIVNGYEQVGGIVGSLINNCLVSNSGVSNGILNSNSNPNSLYIGGIVAFSTDSTFSGCYVKETVVLNGITRVGGILGVHYLNSGNSKNITNCYSKAKLFGESYVGGLIGILQFNSNSSSLMQNSYSSNNINCTSQCGASIGGILGDLTGVNNSYSNVAYNNQTNPSLGATSSPATSMPSGYPCSTLYNFVYTNFDQSNTWNGDNLKIEIPSNYGYCNCSDSCASISPTTPQAVSTQVPTTTAPSTTAPSTITPSTITPSTITPSTITPSTITPSTITPSTITPSTVTPSTLVPSTLEPSTLIPSTIFPTIISPSTSLPTTTSSPCLYNVLNCENCGMRGLILDQSLYNITCDCQDNVCGYSYNPLSPNTTTTISQTTTLNQTTIVIGGNLEIKQSLTLNGSTIIIGGNFNQTSDTTIVVVLTPQSNKNTALNVSGCVTLSGNISLVLDQKPQQEKTNVSLVNYNCTQQLNFTNNQLSVKPTYKNNKCDKIETNINNQQNTLSVSISSTLGCKGLSTGAIVGIIIGAVGGSIIVITLICLVVWKRKKYFEETLSNVDNEMKK